jgi:hypothetical protein
MTSINQKPKPGTYYRMVATWFGPFLDQAMGRGYMMGLVQCVEARNL